MQLPYSVSHKGGKSVLIMKKTLWKNNLNNIKDAPMIKVNFTIAIIILPEKKRGGITFVLLLIHMFMYYIRMDN
jgi:hypothetical protein